MKKSIFEELSEKKPNAYLLSPKDFERYIVAIGGKNHPIKRDIYYFHGIPVIKGDDRNNLSLENNG